MIREILTLVVEKIPTHYYIQFEKDRTWFLFQPTLMHRNAPSFTVVLRDGELQFLDEVDESIAQQAKEKVREILSNMIFDQI